MANDRLERESPAPPGIDTSVPHSARIWNFWLGGKDNFRVDRRAGRQYLKSYPEMVEVARSFRRFMARAVRYLAAEEGVRQFLDVGTGLPTADNTHEVAQQIAAECRIVYVDNDPLVLTHARALLTGSAQGRTNYVDADMHDPDVILSAAARTLDLDAPVALMFIGVLGHVTDHQEARRIVNTLLDGLVPGSYLVLADGTDRRAHAAETERQYARTGAVPYHLRSAEEISGFFDGLDLAAPSVVPLNNWRPAPSPVPPVQIDSIGGVARKPRR